MRVLVACEYSGAVRDAFAREGHDAMSCDLLPTDAPGQHYQGNVMDIIGDGWDLLIAHPPCTYLCSSGLHWNKRVPGRQEKTEDALRLIQEILVEEQLEREFWWSMSEASVTYDAQSKTTKPNPLPRPYFMKQAKIASVPKVKFLISDMPIGADFSSVPNELKPQATNN